MAGIGDLDHGLLGYTCQPSCPRLVRDTDQDQLAVGVRHRGHGLYQARVYRSLYARVRLSGRSWPTSSLTRARVTSAVEQAKSDIVEVTSRACHAGGRPARSTNGGGPRAAPA